VDKAFFGSLNRSLLPHSYFSAYLHDPASRTTIYAAGNLCALMFAFFLQLIEQSAVVIKAARSGAFCSVKQKQHFLVTLSDPFRGRWICG
jgi:hypothetical protein